MNLSHLYNQPDDGGMGWKIQNPHSLFEAGIPFMRFIVLGVLVCLPCLLLFPYIGMSLTADTTQPSYTWISPQPHAVITTNTIRLCVNAYDTENGSGIQWVRFFVECFDYHRSISKSLIGVATSPPYEILWDCSDIPDQNFTKLRFYCEVSDNAGNIQSRDEINNSLYCPPVILDRNPELKNANIGADYSSNIITVDGCLSEWTPSDSIVFKNNDNVITVYAAWNKKMLFMGIDVKDVSVISHLVSDGEDPVSIVTEDDIELYLDPDHDHNPMFSLPDKAYILSPSSTHYEHAYEKNNLNPPILFSSMINGTANKSSDIDRGYVLEIAIPWTELSESNKPIMSMGLEIWNSDKDYRNGTHSYSGWTTVAANLKNPSEWGDIILLAPSDNRMLHAGIFLLVLFLVITGTGMFSINRINRKRSAETPICLLNAQTEINYIIKAKAFIDSHYDDDKLSRKEVADHIGITPSYFGKLFKHETGYTFREYLSIIRLDKAKNLLKSTDKNIAEISYDVGYNTQSYFSSQFKKREHVSPKKYRFLTRNS